MKATKRNEIMSPAQRKVYDAIEVFWSENGYGPTLSDLARMTEQKNVSAVFQHIERLVVKGFVKRKKGGAGARTIRTVPEAERQAGKRQMLLEKTREILQGLSPEERAQVANEIK